MIKPDFFLNNKIYIAFLLFFAFMVLAFWPSYFSIISKQPQVYNHFHGLTMTLWLTFLILQPLLIKLKLKSIHKVIGKFSYFLFPLILLSIFLLFRHTMQGANLQDDFTLSFCTLVILSALAFASLYFLAILNRKKTDIHARYMISTLFPIITPVTDRLFGRYGRELIEYAPTIGGHPVLPFFGFIIADTILLLLLIWDWKSARRLDVYPKVISIVLFFQLSVFTFYKFGWWQSFCTWLLSL